MESISLKDIDEERGQETRAAAGCFNGMPQESFISNWLVTNQINIASNESSWTAGNVIYRSLGFIKNQM